jgi:hypothetical protein
MEASQVLRRYGGSPKAGGPPNINTQVSGRAGARVQRQMMQEVPEYKRRDPATTATEFKLRYPRGLARWSTWDFYWQDSVDTAELVQDTRPTAEEQEAMLRAMWSAVDANTTKAFRSYKKVVLPPCDWMRAPEPEPMKLPRPATYDGPLTHCEYFDRAIEDFEGIVADARAVLQEVDYDTIIGRGLSGALVVPGLARALGKHWAIARKSGDGSHSASEVEGTLGRRWIFVDDFVSSGRTRRAAKDTVQKFCERKRHLTEYVGTWTYQHGSSEFCTDDVDALGLPC